jgi:hypothetical protein
MYLKVNIIHGAHSSVETYFLAQLKGAHFSNVTLEKSSFSEGIICVSDKHAEITCFFSSSNILFCLCRSVSNLFAVGMMNDE